MEAPDIPRLTVPEGLGALPRQRLLGDGMKYRALLAVRAASCYMLDCTMLDNHMFLVKAGPDLVATFIGVDSEEVTAIVVHESIDKSFNLARIAADGPFSKVVDGLKSLEQLRTDAWLVLDLVWMAVMATAFTSVDPLRVAALKDQLAKETIEIQCEATPPCLVSVLDLLAPNAWATVCAAVKHVSGSGYDLEQERVVFFGVPEANQWCRPPETGVEPGWVAVLCAALHDNSPVRVEPRFYIPRPKPLQRLPCLVHKEPDTEPETEPDTEPETTVVTRSRTRKRVRKGVRRSARIAGSNSKRSKIS